MSNDLIIIEANFDAPVSELWKAISDKAEMKKWYFEVPLFNAETGNQFEFYGEGKTGIKYLHKCEVMEVMALQKLSYTWKYDDYEGNSLVTFELTEDGNKSRLKLTHSGLESFPATNSDFERGNFVTGWTYLTGVALKEYFEKKGK